MSSFLLANREPMLQAAKKKKRGTGVPKTPLRMGKVMMTIDAAAQLESVEKGIISGQTISAMYSQTTGPRDSPKLAMKITKPVMMSPLLALVESGCTKKPMATISREMEAIKVPAWSIILRPRRARRKLEIMLATTDSRLRMTGMTLAREGRILAIMSTPQATTELIPTNCCSTARWIAAITLNFLPFLKLRPWKGQASGSVVFCFQQPLVFDCTRFKSIFFCLSTFLTNSGRQTDRRYWRQSYSLLWRSRYFGVSSLQMNPSMADCTTMVISVKPNTIRQ